MGKSDLPPVLIEARNALEVLITVGTQCAMTTKKDWSLRGKLNPEIKHGLEILRERGYIYVKYREGNRIVEGELTNDGKAMYDNILNYFIIHQFDPSKNISFGLGTEAGY